MRYLTLAVIACVCLTGCLGTETTSTAPAPKDSTTATPETAQESSAPEAAPSNPAEAMAAKFGAGIPGAGSAPPEPTGDLVKAEVGVGAKGRSLDNESGLLVTPVKAFFSVQEKLAFEVQLKQAMDLYKASNGNFPKSQAEFDTHIKPMVRLPELPAGHSYVYDPQQGELMVKRGQ